MTHCHVLATGGPIFLLRATLFCRMREGGWELEYFGGYPGEVRTI